MNIDTIKSLILKLFPYNATSGQRTLINKLADFLINGDKNSLFLLRGYAGTGKTTIVSSLVKILPVINKKSVLLAPTGRAAKVLSLYSGKKAFTIHKNIYFPRTTKDGRIALTLKQNHHKNTLFIVDEASMIPDNSKVTDISLFAQRNLLDDLIKYVYDGEDCRLIFIGDSAQLPPVGLSISPALDNNFLQNSYDISIFSYELKEVMRQSLKSGILANATNIRHKINNKKYEFPFFFLKSYDDIEKITGTELEDLLNDTYSKYGSENTIVVTRSNKRANIFNREIRNRILYLEDEISAGDYMMVVRNNYFWLPSDSKAGFIANGDIIELLRIRKIEDIYGFRFADVSIRLIDYPDEKEIDVKILLNTIMAETPSLPINDSKKLFDEIIKDYDDIPRKRSRVEKVINNPYYNALQVKFSYALTCHKTQGGQWDAVFIDQGYITDQMINHEFLRWLYTALTRAVKKLYLINFNDKFFNNLYEH